MAADSPDQGLEDGLYSALGEWESVLAVVPWIILAVIVVFIWAHFGGGGKAPTGGN